MRRDGIMKAGAGKTNQLAIGAALAAVLILLGVLKALMQPEQPPKTVPVVVERKIVTPWGDESAIVKAKKKVEEEKKRKALEAIAEHERAINGDFNDENTPDRLIAVGNLNQYQLGDYYSAIESYRAMIDIAPDHSRTPQAYVEIATCYERLGEEAQAMYVYREMVETLDPSLQHVQFAKLKLAEK